MASASALSCAGAGAAAIVRWSHVPAIIDVTIASMTNVV